MLQKDELVMIRNVIPEDKNFIFATWLKGLRFGNDWYGLIDSKVYFRIYHTVIEALLSRPNISIKVACLKEDHKVILGYSVYSDIRLDWVHVKKSWRGIGLAKDLVPDNITTASHVTDVGRSIIKKKGIIFNPFEFS